jgi:hypothetical protein
MATIGFPSIMFGYFSLGACRDRTVIVASTPYGVHEGKPHSIRGGASLTAAYITRCFSGKLR